MAIAFVQGSTGGGAGTTVVTVGITTTTGNLLVVGVVNKLATATGISDSKSNTWTNLYLNNIATSENLSLWYAKNITGGASHTVSITVSAGGGDCAIVVQEFSGIDTTSPFDIKGIGANTATMSLTSGASSSTTNANDLVVGFMATTTCSPSLGSGYSNLTAKNNSTSEAAMESQVVAATGAQTATFTANINASGNVAVATFKAAGGSPVVTYASTSLMMGI